MTGSVVRKIMLEAGDVNLYIQTQLRESKLCRKGCS